MLLGTLHLLFAAPDPTGATGGVTVINQQSDGGVLLGALIGALAAIVGALLTSAFDRGREKDRRDYERELRDLERFRTQKQACLLVIEELTHARGLIASGLQHKKWPLTSKPMIPHEAIDKNGSVLADLSYAIWEQVGDARAAIGMLNELIVLTKLPTPQTSALNKGADAIDLAAHALIDLSVDRERQIQILEAPRPPSRWKRLRKRLGIGPKP